MTGHGFYQYAVHPRRWDRWYFERYYVGRLRRIDAYAANSEFERDQLIRWGLPPDRIERVPSGISLAEFDPPSEPPAGFREAWGLGSPHIAVYVGGFFENKRVDRLVRALATRGGQWGLVVYGPDRAVAPFDAGSVGRLAAELKVPFRWMGVRPRPEVRSALRAADLIALGSSYEGFGLLLLEAMASERPF
ncbi:glycosyltransferase, partial [mine drainage metagenome]